jgi:hypothetical protein
MHSAQGEMVYGEHRMAGARKPRWGSTVQSKRQETRIRVMRHHAWCRPKASETLQKIINSFGISPTTRGDRLGQTERILKLERLTTPPNYPYNSPKTAPNYPRTMADLFVDASNARKNTQWILLWWSIYSYIGICSISNPFRLI